MSDILTAFSGAKRSDSGGRKVVDKLYGLKGNQNPVFAGSDRPEFTDYNGFESVDVEKEAENIFTRSQEFDSGDWIKGGDAILTPNQSTAPDGTLTADLYENTGNDADRINRTESIFTGKNYTISCHFKEGSANFFGLRTGSYDGIAATYVRYDFSTGGTEAVFGEGVINFGTEKLKDGWLHIFMTLRKTSSDSSTNWRLFCDTGTVFIWGAQLEESAYPTNYIPTQGASVTRLAPSPVIENALPEGLTGSVWGVANIVRDNTNNQTLFGTDNFTTNNLSQFSFRFPNNNVRWNLFGFNAPDTSLSSILWDEFDRKNVAYLGTGNNIIRQGYFALDGKIYKMVSSEVRDNPDTTNKSIRVGSNIGSMRHEILPSHNNIYYDTEQGVRDKFEQITKGTSIEMKANEFEWVNL